MMINDSDGKKKLGKVFGSVKLLYAVLGVAAIAVSLVSYSAVTDRVRQSAENALTVYYEETPTKQEVRVVQPPAATKAQEAEATQGAAEVFGNNAEKVTVSATESATEKPADEQESEERFDTQNCILPLSAAVSKDYSLGYPVYSETMGDWRTHNGVDFPGYEGDAVMSMSDCKITAVYQDDLWGGVVEAECCGITIKYCGLSFNEEVAVGDELSAGDRLGTLSKVPVEAKDGFHLHVEMRENGKLCDPLEILGFAENDVD